MKNILDKIKPVRRLLLAGIHHVTVLWSWFETI